MSFGCTRIADVYAGFARRLEMQLRRMHPHVDPAQIADAVLDAVFGLAETRADLSEADLMDKAAERLKSFLRSDTRRREREEISARSVTERQAVVPSPLERLSDSEQFRLHRERLVQDAAEGAVLDLWLNDHTNAAEIGALVGTPADEVVVILDRLRQRLHRLRKRELGDVAG